MVGLGSRNLMAKTTSCGRCIWNIISIRKIYTHHCAENKKRRRINILGENLLKAPEANYGTENLHEAVQESEKN